MERPLLLGLNGGNPSNIENKLNHSNPKMERQIVITLEVRNKREKK